MGCNAANRRSEYPPFNTKYERIYMSKRTMGRVLAELKAIHTFDLWVADSIKTCIALLEADLRRNKSNGMLPPHQSHSDTSRAAAAAIAPRFGTLTRDVLFQLSRFPYGLTDEEGQQATGMQGNSYRPCRVTLMDSGFVVDSGNRRKTHQQREAVVWHVTPEGFSALKEIQS